MSERETAVDESCSHVESYLQSEIKKCLEEMGETTNPSDAIELAKEVNTWIDFAAGDNQKLFDAWRLRAFQNTEGKIVFIQGREISVNPRKKRK